jgi:hypothetical protein
MQHASPRSIVADCQNHCVKILSVLKVKADSNEPNLGLFAAKLYLYLGEIKMAKLSSFADMLSKSGHFLQLSVSSVQLSYSCG